MLLPILTDDAAHEAGGQHATSMCIADDQKDNALCSTHEHDTEWQSTADSGPLLQLPYPLATFNPGLPIHVTGGTFWDANGNLLMPYNHYISHMDKVGLSYTATLQHDHFQNIDDRSSAFSDAPAYIASEDNLQPPNADESYLNLFEAGDNTPFPSLSDIDLIQALEITLSNFPASPQDGPPAPEHSFTPTMMPPPMPMLHGNDAYALPAQSFCLKFPPPPGDYVPQYIPPPPGAHFFQSTAPGSRFTTPNSSGSSTGSFSLPPSRSMSPLEPVAGPSSAPAHGEQGQMRKNNRKSRSHNPLSIQIETGMAGPPRPRSKCPAVGNVDRDEIERLVKQAKDEQPIECAWNGCGVEIPPTAFADHLRTAHGVTADSTKFRCAWSVDPCGQDLSGSSVVKHLRSGAHLSCIVNCPVCRRTFARPDALGRHLRGDRKKTEKQKKRK
ncbi:hypothetical protein C8R43DRAFT_17531 [Mycena crocata]|nr:hypothetical protein C8R43DRAFT_17531 [Mycena crocata]